MSDRGQRGGEFHGPHGHQRHSRHPRGKHHPFRGCHSQTAAGGDRSAGRGAGPRWWREDKLPVGLLLCTGRDHALVEYALAGMDNHLFVSKYVLELPKKEEIRRFIEESPRQFPMAL